MDVVVVGVGGQGILTCSNILAKASINAGLNVITSEIHGMAQRGGSVEVHVRIARIGEVYSPLVPIGSADAMIALEPLEALRKVEYLNEHTLIVINTRILPFGFKNYPIGKVIDKLKRLTEKVVYIDAYKIAKRAGDERAMNVVMIGAFTKHTEIFTIEEVERAVREVLPKRLHEVNIRALRMGYDLA